MWSLTPLQGGVEPPVQRFGQPAAIGHPAVSALHIARHRCAMSCYTLGQLPSGCSGAPFSLRSSAAAGVRRPAVGAVGRPDPQANRFSGLRPVVRRYAPPSFWPRLHPWRRGRTGQPRPTHAERATYPLVIPNDCRPTYLAADPTHPTNRPCSDAFLGTYKPRSPLLAYNYLYFSIFVL